MAQQLQLYCRLKLELGVLLAHKPLRKHRLKLARHSLLAHSHSAIAA